MNVNDYQDKDVNMPELKVAQRDDEVVEASEPDGEAQSVRLPF